MFQLSVSRNIRRRFALGGEVLKNRLGALEVGKAEVGVASLLRFAVKGAMKNRACLAQRIGEPLLAHAEPSDTLRSFRQTRRIQLFLRKLRLLQEASKKRGCGKNVFV